MGLIVELAIVGLIVVNVLKRRFWPLWALLLLPVIGIALLAGNDGAFAEEAPRWQVAAVILTPVVIMLALLLIPALRVAKPDSWWARKFYDQEKLTRAEERFGTPAPSPRLDQP